MKRLRPKILFIGVVVILCSLIITPMQLLAIDEQVRVTAGISITKGECGNTGVKVFADARLNGHSGNTPYYVDISKFDGSATLYHFAGTISGESWSQTYQISLDGGHYRAYFYSNHGGYYSYFSIDECTNKIEFTPSGYMNTLFKKIFGRTPTDEELQALLNKLSEGMGASEIVKEFILSKESQARLSVFTNEEFLTFLYNVLLFREPETEGLNAWLARMS